MKKVVVITNFDKVANFHKDVLEYLFEGKIEVETYSYDKGYIDFEIEADLYLISIYSIYVEVKKYINPRGKVIIIGTTINEKQYEKIKKIPKNSKIMVVNYSPEMTMETIALFRQVGLDEYDFVPYYLGKVNTVQTDFVLTTGEAHVAPHWVEDIIDIDDRTLDMSTIIDTAISIEQEDILKSKKIINHFKKLKKPSIGISKLINDTNVLESRFLELINVIDEGIIVTDVYGHIYTINEKAKSILNLGKMDFDRMNISEIINHISITRAIKKKRSLDVELIKINNCNISFKAVPVETVGEITGIIMIFERFEEKEKSQHNLRKQLVKKGYVAKYNFEDIKGSSKAIEDIKKRANKMAKSDLSILITGESGVGKELFAQSIHNASYRKDYQFVAINCAAIPENLLESELFGYDEGAFTGAKKGGRMGLFEIAHNGTIFLDEIGEMPLHLQTRLLRVIQEREVMRICGDRVIHVDIRIIAATHRNLKELSKQGKFRSDLYYRLNVLPLKIPPLRDRGNDILILFNHIKANKGLVYELSKESEAFLLNYKWEGNLRELINCIEFLNYIDKDVIELEDLQEYFLEDEDLIKEYNENTIAYYDENSSFDEGKKFILRCMKEAMLQLRGIGRPAILKKAREENIYISEVEIRKILLELELDGIVAIGKGRGGTKLTQKGIETIKSMKDIL
ncbi:sigma-54 interaction domain-containing protein [Faecalimicrobium sp. JNUCC 81]